MVVRTTYIADKAWKYSHGFGENTDMQVFIMFTVRLNPTMDNAEDKAYVYRGFYHNKNLGVKFNFDYVNYRVDHGARGRAGYFGVVLGYVFSDLIWEAYTDAVEANGVAPESRRTKSELESEFTAAHNVVSYADGITPWLRAWRLIFLKSDGLVIDPALEFPTFRAIRKNDRFPRMRLDLMESRFQSDYEDLMRSLS